MAEETDPTSGLPQITPIAPVVIPAQPQLTFGRLWVTAIQISAPSPTATAQAVVQLVPYDPSTGTMSPRDGDKIGMQIADVFAESAKYPVVGQAVGTLLAAIAGLYPIKHLEQQVKDIESGLPQFQQELANAREQLTIAIAAPVTNINKTFNLTMATNRIAAAQAQIDSLKAALAPLQAQLAAAVANLS